LTVQDRDLRVIRANRFFEQDFGRHGNRHCYELLKGSSERCDLCPVAASFEDGRRHRVAEEVRCRDGRLLTVLVHTTPITDAEGQVTSVLQMGTDITSMRRLQESLAESQERYRLLFGSVPCYISIQDRDLRILEANRLFKEEFGDDIGAKCYEIYKHRTEQCVPCPVQDTFRDGKVHHSEEAVTSRSGREINTMVYSAPIVDSEGGIKSVMEMSADITPIRELQSQLESIGLLISSVSHGVRGLLNGLDGGMYLLKTGVSKGIRKRQDQGLEMVQRNVDRIRGMVMNILYYAKERTPNLEAISAREIAEEAISVIEGQAEQLAIGLKLEIADAAGEFQADRQAVRSLLINLLENGLDACRVKAGERAGEVGLVVRDEGGRVTFEVSDNGIGMDRETKEKAFGLFFTSKGVKGTGLGLFIANKIAMAHGGEVELESEEGQGTRITVVIPRSSVEKKGEQERHGSSP